MSDIKVITAVQHKRRWTPKKKWAIVEEAEKPGMRIFAVARKYDIKPNQLFNWHLFDEARGSGGCEEGWACGSYIWDQSPESQDPGAGENIEEKDDGSRDS